MTATSFFCMGTRNFASRVKLVMVYLSHPWKYYRESILQLDCAIGCPKPALAIWKTTGNFCRSLKRSDERWHLKRLNIIDDGNGNGEKNCSNWTCIIVLNVIRKYYHIVSLSMLQAILNTVTGWPQLLSPFSAIYWTSIEAFILIPAQVSKIFLLI